MATPASPLCIASFTGRYQFLSNFSQTDQPIILWNQVWQSAEHAFQAGKASNPDDFRWVRDAPTPAEAKRRGRQITLRRDWEQIKRTTMLQVVFTKFSNQHLRDRLVATGDATLIEGNGWHDTYWGAVPDAQDLEGQVWQLPNGTYLAGRNWLGRILMSVRELMAPEAP